MDASVHKLAVWRDRLFATGNFSTAGGVYANSLAAWGPK